MPTIATSVPRAAFAWVTQKMKAEFAAAGIATPLVTSNRINTPEVAEQVLADGCADMVSMARPLLADADFVKKARAGPGRPHQHLHRLQPGLPGPCVPEQDQPAAWSTRAPATRPSWCTAPRRASARKRIAVVGAGPAGLTAATLLAERGHEVHLFDAAADIGGQLNMARQVPGKEEFDEMLRYFRHARGRHRRGTAPEPAVCKPLTWRDFDEVIVATGVEPRDPKIPGQDHPKVLSYIDVLRHGKPVGERVAIIGAGGIGFDVAEFLVHSGHPPPRSTCPPGRPSGA